MWLPVTSKSLWVSTGHSKLQVTCTLWFTCKHITVNTYHISKGMGFRKLSNSKSDLQGHSRSLLQAPFDRSHDFLLLFHCSYIFILYQFRDIITYFSKIKQITWPEYIPFRGRYFMHAVVLVNSISVCAQKLKCTATPISMVWCTPQNLKKWSGPRLFKGRLSS